MAFCSNCGTQLNKGAKFCSECGAPVDAASRTNSHRRTVYDGEIHKCPNCGETLNSFMAVCPACGYELRGATSSNGVKEFAEKLTRVSDEQQLINLIRGFSIPNTREDIYEFFILASSNYDSNFDNQEISKAWLAKIEQCYQKASILLKNDPEYTEVASLYSRIHTKIRNARIRQFLFGAGKTSVSLASTVLRASGKSIGIICGIAAFFKAISMDKAGENGVGFELLGGLLLVISACLLARKSVTMIEFLFAVAGGILSFVLANQLENGSGLQLMGVVELIIVAVNFVRFLCSGRSDSQ